MPGGRFDSSKTRVAPVFDALLARDASGESWLPTLLTLPSHGSSSPREPAVGPIVSHGWEPNETGLDPPLSLLSWLIRNIEAPKNSSEKLEGRRQRLVDRDPGAIRAALREVRERHEARGWYIFEGPTFPDVFIETEQVVIVIEGKRTERGPTTSTKWMPVRHQMLRHLDCALEIVGGRRLFGFFIAEVDERGGLPLAWADAVEVPGSGTEAGRGAEDESNGGDQEDASEAMGVREES